MSTIAGSMPKIRTHRKLEDKIEQTTVAMASHFAKAISISGIEDDTQPRKICVRSVNKMKIFYSIQDYYTNILLPIIIFLEQEKMYAGCSSKTRIKT